jgi:hypothetical protein
LYYLNNKKFKNDDIFLFLKVVDESKVKKFKEYFDKNYAKNYLSNLNKIVTYNINEKDINVSTLFSIILKNNEKQ